MSKDKNHAKREAPDKAPADAVPAVPPSRESGVERREPDSPSSSGSRFITIDGEGELLLSVRGEMRNIPRGVPVEVGADIMSVLEGSSIKFKEGKGGKK